MDTCIASSIAQRTTYILNTLGEPQKGSAGSRPNQNPLQDYGTFPTLTASQNFAGSKPDVTTTARINDAIGQLSFSTPNNTIGNRVGITVKPKSSGTTAHVDRSFSNHQAETGQSLPPSVEGSRDGRVGQVPDNVPRYDTHYCPKSYQPLQMFNLWTPPLGNKAGTERLAPGQSNFRHAALDSANPVTTSYSFGTENLSRDMPRIHIGNANRELMVSNANNVYGSSSYPWQDYTTGGSYTQHQDNGQQSANTMLKTKANGNKKSNKTSKCKSATKARNACISKSSGGSSNMGRAKVQKSCSENPDHNNNFFKCEPGAFFCQRKKMPCGDDDMEVTGKDRINLLAQPKLYPCAHIRCRCGEKKLTPEAMQRLRTLAQPKLCHFTVCSCCLSPDCLGECSSKFKVNRTSCPDLACVDWDRLATPRAICPPAVKPQVAGAVKSSALKPLANKRIDKLSVPKKVIDSDDYYLWLWNKKPDVHVYLKPIQRLSVARCDLKDTRVLLRCDLDFTQGKSIDCKVRDVLPTMQMALKKDVKSLVLISRCGPEGIPKDSTYSLKPLAQVFEQYLDTRVIFLDDCCGFQAQALCEDPVPGTVFLLENLAFHAEEIGWVMEEDKKVLCKKENVAKFQKIISDHGDVYITDSFTELFKMTNTTVGYPAKEFGYGFNVRKELSIFQKFAIKPPVPVLAIVAGPFDKTWTVVRNLMGKVSDILIGGQMAYVFMKAIKGIELGNTECSEKMLKTALKLFSRAKDTQTTLHLPSDVVVRNTNTDEYFVALTREDIDEWFEIVDIGPHTRNCYTATIRNAAAILWLGDFGCLSDGTEKIKEAYLAAAASGTPTYAADDKIKELISITSKPEECIFVTGDGQVSEDLLRGHIPKGLAVLSKSRKKLKREPVAEDKSTKPISYELPGMMIPGGNKAGATYATSHSMMCINHIPLENLKILIRVEFNEPMKDSTVTNNYRIRMTIPTIKYALKWRARSVVVLAHFRNPQGRRDSDYSLKPICDEMASLLGETVIFVPRTVGKDVMTTINLVHPGSVLMLENVRFHTEEDAGFMQLPDGRLRPGSQLRHPARILPSGYTAETNAQFCEELSRLGDIFVNDAFGALHLDHSSVTGNFRPTRVCGFLVKNELKYLAKLLNYPDRQFLVILGGTNIEDKIDILPGILKEADSLILAGTMACLFLKVEHGLKTGRMTFSEKLQDKAREMIKLASYYKCRIHYPVDLAVSQEQEGQFLKQVSISEGVPSGYVFVDIGQLSASMFTRIIKRKHMIFWSGTTGNGLLEYDRSSTKLLMEALYSVTHDPEKAAVTIVGGRGLSQIVEKYDPDHEAFTHLTTGGRAALQLLAQRHVIGLDSLLTKPGRKPLSVMSATEYNEFRDAVVMIRCDLDLPLDEDPPINVFPLQHLVDTIKFIQKKGAKTILLVSHRGFPDGEHVEALSLEPIKPVLEGMLDQTIEWAPTMLTADDDSTISNTERGGVILTENVCFHPEEAGYMRTKAGDWVPVSHEVINQFRSHLSSLADVVVNESFASLHRAYSSVVGISGRPCIAGAYLKKQIYDYVDIRRQMDGAFLLILGSEDLDDIFPKLLLLLNALDLLQEVFLCGNMAAVFKPTSAQSNMKEFRDAQLLIPRITHKARLNKVTINQITDCYATKDAGNPEEEPRLVQLDSMPRGFTRCDWGPASLAAISASIRAARLIVLCGPTGDFQYEHYTKGNMGVLSEIAAVTKDGSAVSVALGMRTGQLIQQLGHADSFSNYSVEAEPFFEIMTRRPLAALHVLDRMPANPLLKLSIEQMSLNGKRVLMRLDLDVPSVEGVVLDTDKLEDATPTIMYALNQGAKCVVLMGHRGEPAGFKNHYLRMKPLEVEISAILGMDVQFIDRPCSRKAKRLLEDPPFGSVFLLENLKFYPAESGVDAEPRTSRTSKRIGEASLTEVSDLPKDDANDDAAEDDEKTEALGDDLEEEESSSDEAHSVSDGDGGQSVDSLMYQLMRPKTVEQFVFDLAACGDVFVNDDVAHVEEPLTSYAGFGLQERGCGLQLADFLRDSEEASVYQLPGVEGLSPAP